METYPRSCCLNLSPCCPLRPQYEHVGTKCINQIYWYAPVFPHTQPDPVASKFVGHWDGGTLLGNVIDSSFHKFWPIHFRAIGKVWPRRGAVFFRMFSWRWVQIETIWDPISANGSNHGLCYSQTINSHLKRMPDLHHRQALQELSIPQSYAPGQNGRSKRADSGFCWCKDRKSWYFRCTCLRSCPYYFLKIPSLHQEFVKWFQFFSAGIFQEYVGKLVEDVNGKALCFPKGKIRQLSLPGVPLVSVQLLTCYSNMKLCKVVVARLS